MGANGSLTVRNIIGQRARAATPATARRRRFHAYHSQFINSARRSACTRRTAICCSTACWVDSNVGGGINVNAGDFTSASTASSRKNTGSGGFYQVATGTATTFVNNTVADNTSSVTANAGVNCPPPTARSSCDQHDLLQQQSSAAARSPRPTAAAASTPATTSRQARSRRSISTMQTPGFKGGMPLTADSYHLLPTSPCISEGAGAVRARSRLRFRAAPRRQDDDAGHRRRRAAVATSAAPSTSRWPWPRGRVLDQLVRLGRVQHAGHRRARRLGIVLRIDLRVDERLHRRRHHADAHARRRVAPRRAFAIARRVAALRLGHRLVPPAAARQRRRPRQMDAVIAGSRRTDAVVASDHSG